MDLLLLCRLLRRLDDRSRRVFDGKKPLRCLLVEDRQEACHWRGTRFLSLLLKVLLFDLEQILFFSTLHCREAPHTVSWIRRSF